MPSLSLKIVQDGGAVTRKVKFDSRMTVKDAHKLVKDKVIVPDKTKEYALFLRSADDDMTGVWLDNERTLDYYMLRDGDSLDYLCTVRNLRVRMLDDTVKTLQVDEAKTVGELMFNICARIGITNYEEYGLCREEVEEVGEEAKENKEQSTGTLTLTRKRPNKERDVALEQLSKKLKTDDNVEWLDQHRTLREQGVDTNETLLLKRRLFFSDRNVDSRDPLQLNLLYVQTRDAILNGRHLVTEQQAADCKVRWINIRDVHRRILKKNFCDNVKPRKQYKYERYLTFMKPFYKDIPVGVDDDNDDGQDQDQDVEDNEGEDENAWEEVPIEFVEEFNSDESEVPIKRPRKSKKKKIVVKNKKVAVRKEKVVDDDDDDDDDEDEKLRPALNETQGSQTTSDFEPTDPVDAFLLSIGATLKTFSPYHLNVAKSQIFAIVQEHDLEQIVQRQKVTTSENSYEQKITADNS